MYDDPCQYLGVGLSAFFFGSFPCCWSVVCAGAYLARRHATEEGGSGAWFGRSLTAGPRAIVVGGGKVGEVEEGGGESCHGRPAGSPPRDGRCSEGRLAVEVLCPASNLTKLCDARLHRLPASMLAAGQGVSSSEGNQGSVDGLLGRSKRVSQWR